jgi:uncharacterized delta-60 repeat protein
MERYFTPDLGSTVLSTDPTPVISGSQVGLTPLAISPQPSSASQLLFIDGRVANAQSLIAAAQPGTAIYVMDDSQDAIAQITNTLLGRTNITALTIVSHGQAGGLWFGDQALNLDNLSTYTDQLQTWRSALTGDADILLYGCNVAQGSLGQAFVEQLSAITAADVAASNNLTGSVALGGDWILEVQTGAIAQNHFLTQTSQYAGLLAPADFDPTWGTTGKVSTDLSGSQPDFLTKLLVQTDGKVIAAGGWKDAPTQFAVVRYNANGTLDTTFGSNGVQLVPLFANGPSRDDTIASAALQADGKMVLVGATYPNPGGLIQVGVVRLNANGSLDTSFDTDGYVQIDASQLELGANQSSSASSVAVQADGKLVIAANISNRSDNNSHAAVIRLTPTGGLDATFGSNGIVAFQLESNGFTTAANALLQADGNIVVVGDASRDITGTYRSDIIAFRLLGPNGNLDSTFNGGNLLTLAPTTLERSIAQNFDAIGNATLQADGKIVIVGSASDYAYSFADAFALRLNSNGTLDNTFGGNGVVLTDVNGGDDTARDVVVQKNGKIAVVGSADQASSTNNDSLILRYAADGSLDPTWNSTGKLTIDSGLSPGEQAYSVALQADGKLLVAAADGAANFNDQNFYSLRLLGDPATTVSLSTATATINEGGAGTFTIARGSETTGALTVNLTIAGTSTSGDYTLSGASVTVNGSNVTVVIPNGQSSVTLSMAALAETLGIAEAAETLRLDLAAGSGYAVDNAVNNATITITQNGFVVTTNADSGEGSLRQAILNANALAGTDTITFAGTMADTTADTIALTSGELGITSNLTLIGTGTNLLTLSGNSASRVFTIFSGTVNIDGVTITGGNSSIGGGIYSNGNLTITNSIFSGNTSSSNLSAIDGGGAIYNSGTLVVRDSTISNNVANGQDHGGGIFNDITGNLTIERSTLSGNTTTNSGGGIYNAGTITSLSNSTLSGNLANGDGGGLRSVGGTVTLTNLTITANRADRDDNGTGDGGGLSQAGSTITVSNSLIAQNSDSSTSGNNYADVSGSFTDGSANLIGNSTGSTSFTTSTLVGTAAAPINPLLSALGNYGGTTPTHALLSGSSAINAAGAGATATDQRGIFAVGTRDIGAFESRGFTISATGGATQSTLASSVFASPLGVTVVANRAIEPVAGGTVTYSAPSSGASASLSSATALINASGTANVTATANTTNGSYTVTTGGNGITGTANFSLTNSNNPPVVTATNFNVAENSPNNTVVGTVTATNVDAGQTLTYSITAGNTGSAFAINSTTGQITVADGTQLNFESATKTYSLTVQAQDNGTGTLTGSNTITLNLTDVNEAPVVTATSFNVAENSANGTVVGTVSASDVDAGQTLAYSITAGNTGSAFAINSTTGQITVADGTQLNFEGTKTYSLTVQAQDNGTGTLTGNNTITINLTDVNEAPTVNAIAFNVAENSANGTVIGTAPASDVDAGQTLTYSITGGNTGSAFAINSSTGQITVADGTQLNFEGTKTYSLTVQARDNGTGTLTGSNTITLNLTDANEAPSLTGNATLTAILEDATVNLGDTIANLFSGKFSDVDAGASLGGIAVIGNPTIAASTGNWQYSTDGTTWFNIATVADDTTALALAASTKIRFAPVTNYNGTPSPLTVRALDNTQTSFTNGATRVTVNSAVNGGATAIAATPNTITTSITAVNDAPSFTKGTNQTVTAGDTLQTIPLWATGLFTGPADEASQTVTYQIVSNSNPSLFTVAPTIAATGQLTYQPVSTITTTTVVTLGVVAQDNGGTANGGVDTSVIQTFTITIAPKPVLTIANVTVKEGNAATTPQTFTVKLDQASSATITVDYQTVDGNATVADNDYVATAGTVTFTPGQIEQTITVTTKGDVKLERDEFFAISLSNAKNVILGNTGANLTVLDDDRYSNSSSFNQFDFTGDGKADLLWRNNVTGENIIWGMNGPTQVGATYLPTVDIAWSIAALGDFDGNGQGDILWRNATTKEVVIWRMNGTAIADQAYVATNVRVEWQLGGTGDFNGDGKTDLLWRNTATGENAVWLINGIQPIDGYYLTTITDQKWQVAGVGDFNGDGKADIVWHNDFTGQNVLWQLNRATIVSQDYLSSTAFGWQVAATSDIDGDGTADIVWRNYTTGETAVWFMKDLKVSRSNNLPAATDLNWKIVGSGDFNHDGKADLIWRNYSTGEDVIWTMAGDPIKPIRVQNFTTQVADFSWNIS